MAADRATPWTANAGESFLAKLRAQWPAENWGDVTVLVALSGGADSVALLRGLCELRPPKAVGRLIAVHLNHALRGEESEADARFCQSLCDQCNLELVAENVASGALQRKKEGLEEAARDARYEFFKRTAMKLGARYVVTAHTASDQVETILHRLLRGTGVSGLAGISAAREFIPGVSLRRPLLQVSRQQVLAYLTALGQSYCEDSSNESRTYTRNRIRHDLLPMLRSDFNPQVEEALLRLAEQAREQNDFTNQQVQSLLPAMRKVLGASSLQMDGRQLASLHPWLQRELLRQAWSEMAWPLQGMTKEKWEELQTFASDSKTTVQRQDFPGGIRAEKQGEWLSLTRPAL